jgi:hypothetical protein
MTAMAGAPGFWGDAIEPTDTLVLDPELDEILHLTQFALGTGAKDNERVMIYAEKEKKSFVVGTLTKGSCDQFKTDLLVAGVDQLRIRHSSKKATVYITGYRQIDIMGDDAGLVEDMYEGDGLDWQDLSESDDFASEDEDRDFDDDKSDDDDSDFDTDDGSDEEFIEGDELSESQAKDLKKQVAAQLQAAMQGGASDSDSDDSDVDFENDDEEDDSDSSDFESAEDEPFGKDPEDSGSDSEESDSDEKPPAKKKSSNKMDVDSDDDDSSSSSSSSDEEEEEEKLKKLKGSKRRTSTSPVATPTQKRSKTSDSAPSSAASTPNRTPVLGDAKSYEADLVNFLRQHGDTTMAIIGTRVKKPSGVPKLGQFIETRTNVFQRSGDKIGLV